jgi:hypothetical protein
MVKEELIKRSPLRILEKSINGGVGKGNIGVISSKKGVGKTACLVHIATDKLFSEKSVIHVSFSKRTDHIISWYEDIFNEISKKKNLEKALEIHDEIIRHRVIMNFNQEGIDIAQILKSLEAMIVNGNFKADTIIIDGLDVNTIGIPGLEKIKDFAKKLDLEIWISVSLKNNEPLFKENGVPYEIEDVIPAIDVLMTLKNDGKNIRMDVIKDHESISLINTHLFLDSKTLLIADN